MSRSEHYDVKKKYYELFANNPDYPAWQDFELRHLKYQPGWERLWNEPKWQEGWEYRYNPLPKKWEPKDKIWRQVLASKELTKEDIEKLQSYATKLSWLREQGGYEFEIEKCNFFTFKDHENSCYRLLTAYDQSQQTDGVIYMNEKQAEKWLKMIKNGEV